MFNQAGAFIDLNRQIRGQVKVADDDYVPIRGFGTSALWKSDGSSHLAVLSNVLYVPDLKENLVGHKAMCKQGFSFNIAANGTPTLTRDGTNVCQLVEMGDLYHYPRRLFFPYHQSDAEWLQSKAIVRDTC